MQNNQAVSRRTGFYSYSVDTPQEDSISDSSLLHSKDPRAMNLVTCGTIRIEKEVLTEKRRA